MDIFLTKNFAKEAEETSREEQIAYLKKHEKGWTNAIKKQNAKVISVQYDWDSVEVGVIGNGTPQGAGYAITLSGGFNNIKDSNFMLSFELTDKNSLPNGAYYIQDLSILKNGGWVDYE
ncbi:hypothetical protein [Lactovum odontotermitis]